MLFNITETTQTAAAEAYASGQNHPVQTGSFHLLNEAWSDIYQAIGNIQPDHHYNMISEGKWSAIHLLKYLLSQCGRSKVLISSWSVSENSVRAMVELNQTNVITDLKCLFDHRVVLHTPGAYEMARLNFAVKLSMVHAKITVVQGDTLSAVVIGSANYNDNRRIEVGIISTHPADVQFYADFITLKMNENAGLPEK
jgi:hypothetical protein